MKTRNKNYEVATLEKELDKIDVKSIAKKLKNKVEKKSSVSTLKRMEAIHKVSFNHELVTALHRLKARRPPCT